MFNIAVILIAISVAMQCRNAADPHDGQTGSQTWDSMSVVINGLQWSGYYPNDDKVRTELYSYLGPVGTDSERVYLIAGCSIRYSSYHVETVTIQFVFEKHYDFSRLDTLSLDLRYSASNQVGQLRFYEDDDDVIIGRWDQYDSMHPVWIQISNFDISKQTVEVRFEGKLMIAERDTKPPYPGRRRPDTLHVTQGFIREHFTDSRQSKE
jgi:hypothetical protein